MKSIQQTYVIEAPLSEVWKALTDGPTAEQWGAAPAKVDAREGGEFSYWDGDIHGVFTKLIPEKLIEQDWYGHDNPTEKYTVSFEFEGDDKTATVRMTYSGNIFDKQKDIADWRDYYFEPIKKSLEESVRLSPAAEARYAKEIAEFERERRQGKVKSHNNVDDLMRNLLSMKV